MFIVAAPPGIANQLCQNEKLLATIGTPSSFVSTLTEKLVKPGSFIVIFLPEEPHEGFDNERWEEFARLSINNPKVIVFSEKFLCSNSCVTTNSNLNYAAYEIIGLGEFTAEVVIRGIKFLRCKNDPDCELCIYELA